VIAGLFEGGHMRVRTWLTTLLVTACASLALAPAAHAQLADRKALTLEAATRIMRAAEAEALKHKWTVAIAIADEAGELILFQKLDETQVGSVNIAIGKARTAARFKRPTKAFEDTIAKGRSTLMTIEGLMPLEGGVPIIVEGRVIGAVGVSGVTSQQDAQIAEAGIAALGTQ
jgi:glc operon protein GlcG